MNKLALLLADYLLKENKIDKDSYEIYQYGLQIALELLVTTSTCILISIYLHMPIECIVFFSFFIPLRSYAGGVHLEKFINCYFLSSITLTAVLLLTHYCNINSLLSIVIFFITVVLLIRVAPVGINKRNLDNDDVKCYRRKIVIILLIAFIFNIIFAILKYDKIVFLISMAIIIVTIAAYHEKSRTTN
jgi:accessory gene regulator B